MGTRYYLERKVREEAPNLASEEVLPLKVGAEMLGMSLSGLMSALDRGSLTTVIEAGTWGRERRRVLRAEVEAEVARRAGGE